MSMLIFDKKAFSLIELMIAVVILGIISMSIATGFSSLFRQKGQALTQSEVHNIQSALASYLYNNTSCSAELSGKPAPRSRWANLQLTRYKGFGDWGGVLQTGSDLGKIQIEQLKIRKKPGSLTDYFKDGVTRYKINIVQIKIQFKLTHLGPKLFTPFYIELPIFTRYPYTRISSCYAGAKLAYFCSALGLSYDRITHACSPQHRCLMKGFYSKEYCPGRVSSRCQNTSSAQVNAITKQYRCPSGASAIQIGEYKNNYIEGCGKKCTRTVERRIKSYLCMHCY